MTNTTGKFGNESNNYEKQILLKNEIFSNPLKMLSCM